MKAICLDIINGTFEKNIHLVDLTEVTKSTREQLNLIERMEHLKPESYKSGTVIPTKAKSDVSYAITLARGKGEVIGEGAVKFRKA